MQRILCDRMQSVFDWVHDKEMGTMIYKKNITFVDNKHQFCDSDEFMNIYELTSWNFYLKSPQLIFL